MAMVWHDYGCMQIQLISMLPETTLQNCIPRNWWKLPSMGCSESNEERTIVFLDVGEATSVIVLSLHKDLL